MMSSLPNFYMLNRIEDIRGIINSINLNFPKIIKSDEYDKKLINYISAAFDEGFDVIRYDKDFRKDKNALKYIWNMYSKEVKKIFGIERNLII